MANTIEKVGFIGLGSMGGDQARELAKLDYDLTVYDAFPAAMEKFEGKAALASSIADLGACDVVGICVQNDEQVTACVDELLPVMDSGSVILVHSTIRPEKIKELADRASAKGVEMMDAPVTRTKVTDDGPFVFCMLGGREDLYNHVQKYLNAFSTDTMLVGALGSALALKICNNLMSWGSILMAMEVFDMAEAAGVPAEKLMQVMSTNGNLTLPAKGFLGFRADPGDQQRRDTMAVQAGIGEKDLSLANELGTKVGKPSKIAASTSQYVKEAILEMCRR